MRSPIKERSMATTAINFSADSGTKPAEASQDNHFFKLFEGDAVRIAKACGLKAGAAYMAVAAHTKCWAAVSTIAQLSGHRSDRAASRQLGKLDDAGFIKIRPRRRKTSIYTVAHSDSSRQRYAQISRPWLYAH